MYDSEPVKALLSQAGAFVAILLFLILAATSFAHAQKVVRVGVYGNMPLSGVSEDGQVQGVYIDVLQEVAARQDWTLEFVPDLWPRLHDMLRNAEIDLLPVVAYSTARTAYFDFDDTTLLANWGVVYTPEDTELSSIMELQGLRLGLQPEDIHAKAMLHLLDRFQIQAEIVPYASYEDIFRALQEGRVEAGVISRFFGSMHAREFAVTSSSIVFNPIEIRYAVPKGDPAGLLPGLNTELPEIKNDKGSVFHRSLQRWLGGAAGGVPLWFWQALWLTAALLCLFAGLSFWLRRVVHVKTQDLQRQKEELEGEIRQRASVQQALMQSEYRYRTLVEHVGEGLAVAQEGRLCYVNPKLCEITGYSEAQLLETPIAGIVLPEDRHIVEENHRRRVQEQEALVAYEFRILRSDGEIRWLRLTGVCIEWEGAPASLAFMTDVTQRREDLQRLHMLTAMVEQSTESLTRADTDFRIRYMNRAAEELYGWHLEELEGHRPDVFNAEPDAEEIQNDIYDAIAQGREYDGELLNRKKNGEIFHVRLKVSPIRDEQGVIIGYMAFQRDITRRKEAERAILQNQQELQDAMAQVEEASRAKSRFLANMSHEIRTPLNGIMGMLQLLQATSLEQESSEYVQLAILSSRRLIKLVDDILDISRVEAGVLAISREPFDLHETVHSLAHLFGPSAQQQNINLLCTVDERIPRRLLGDAARLQQVLNNLVGNAVKFSQGGEVRIEASLLPVLDTNSRRVLLEIADTGIGIPDDKISQLFDPFTQAEESYARRYQGAGLGLSIVKQLVSLMGGALAVVSQEGQGTTFYISMPFFLALEDTATQGVSGEQGELSAALLPDKDAQDHKHVLLAEDDAVSRLVVAGMLRKRGWQVAEALDGLQALDMLRKDTFDLVLMDIQMPGCDGLEVTRRLRNDPAFAPMAHVPVLALTAYAMDGDKERFLAAGMDDYLAKPVDIDDLEEVMFKILGAAQIRRN